MCTLQRGLVLQVAFSPSELKLATAGDDSEVRVWDLNKKSCVATLKVCHQYILTLLLYSSALWGWC
jgi:WD40 repeat protein